MSACRCVCIVLACSFLMYALALERVVRVYSCVYDGMAEFDYCTQVSHLKTWCWGLDLIYFYSAHTDTR